MKKSSVKILPWSSRQRYYVLDAHFFLGWHFGSFQVSRDNCDSNYYNRIRALIERL